jgi:hypothetical protein
VVEVGGSALRHLFNYGFDLDRTWPLVRVDVIT